MPERSVGINSPRLGVTQSLAAPGVQPARPSQPIDKAALLNEFMQGIAGTTAGGAGVIQSERELHDLEAIEASAREQSGHPILKSRKYHDWYWANEASISAASIDLENAPREPGEDLANVAKRELDARISPTSPAIYIQKLRYAVEIQLARATANQVAQAKKDLAENAIAGMADMAANNQEGIPKKYATAKDVLIAHGLSETTAREKLIQPMLQAAAENGHTALVHELAGLAKSEDVTYLVGNTLEVAQDNYRRTLAESATFQIGEDFTRARQELDVTELHRKAGNISESGAMKNKQLIQALVAEHYSEALTTGFPTGRSAESYREEWTAALGDGTLNEGDYATLNNALQQYVELRATNEVYALADSPDSTLESVERFVDKARNEGVFKPERAVDIKRDIAAYMQQRERQRIVGEVLEGKRDIALDKRDAPAVIGELIRRGIADGEPANASGAPPRYRGIRGNQHILWAAALNATPGFIPDDIVQDISAKVNSPDSDLITNGALAFLYLDASGHPKAPELFDALPEVAQGRIVFILDQFKGGGGTWRNLHDPAKARTWIAGFGQQLVGMKSSGLSDDNVRNIVAGRKFDEPKPPTAEKLIPNIQEKLQRGAPEVLLAKKFWSGRLKEIEAPTVGISKEWLGLAQSRIRAYVMSGMSHEAAEQRANQDAIDIILNRHPLIVWDNLSRWTEGGGPASVGGEREVIIGDLRTVMPEADLNSIERNYRPMWSEQHNGRVLKRTGPPFDLLRTTENGQPVTFVSRSRPKAAETVIDKTQTWAQPGVLKHATDADFIGAQNVVGNNPDDIEAYLNAQGKTGMYEVE